MLNMERRKWSFTTSSNLKTLLQLRVICIREDLKRFKTFIIMASSSQPFSRAPSNMSCGDHKRPESDIDAFHIC